MNISDIVDEWKGFKKDLDDSALTDSTERRAAKELIEAKAYIPDNLLKDSGLDQYDSEAQLLKDPDKLLEIAAFFSDISISSRTVADDDGSMGYEVRLSNTSLFRAILLIDFAATLYHITGGFPLNVRVFVEDEDTAKGIGDIFSNLARSFHDVKSCTIYVDSKNEEVEEESNADDKDPLEHPWAKDLDAAVEEFDKTKKTSAYERILSLILNGLEYFVPAVVPAEPGDEDRKIQLQLLESGDDSYGVLLTKPEKEFEYLATRSFFNVLTELRDRNVSGLVINPYEENIIISRYFTDSVLDVFIAGVKYEKERPDHEDQEDDGEGLSKVVETDRPMTEAEFENIENILRNLVHEEVESFLVVDFNNYVNDDKVLFMQAKSWGDGYHVEIGFDMEDFDWDHPLILGADDVSYEDTVELFRKIGLDGAETGDIEFITNNFKDIGFKG